jgi:hypothetical protein
MRVSGQRSEDRKPATPMHWTASTRPSSSSGMSRCLPTRRTSLRATRQLSSFKLSQGLRSALTGGSLNIFKCGSEILNVFRDERRPGTGAWRQARLRRSVRAVRTTSPSSCPRRCGSGSYGAPALISGIGLELAARFIANSSFPARVRGRWGWRGFTTPFSAGLAIPKEVPGAP